VDKRSKKLRHNALSYFSSLYTINETLPMEVKKKKGREGKDKIVKSLKKLDNSFADLI